MTNSSTTIRRGLEALCAEAPEPACLDPIDALLWYWRFENIHPFTDGNGRTGKIMLNFLLGRMADPVFPPHDLCPPDPQPLRRRRRPRPRPSGSRSAVAP